VSSSSTATVAVTTSYSN